MAAKIYSGLHASRNSEENFGRTLKNVQQYYVVRLLSAGNHFYYVSILTWDAKTHEGLLFIWTYWASFFYRISWNLGSREQSNFHCFTILFIFPLFWSWIPQPRRRGGGDSAEQTHLFNFTENLISFGIFLYGKAHARLEIITSRKNSQANNE